MRGGGAAACTGQGAPSAVVRGVGAGMDPSSGQHADAERIGRAVSATAPTPDAMLRRIVLDPDERHAAGRTRHAVGAVGRHRGTAVAARPAAHPAGGAPARPGAARHRASARPRPVACGTARHTLPAAGRPHHLPVLQGIGAGATVTSSNTA